MFCFCVTAFDQRLEVRFLSIHGTDRFLYTSRFSLVLQFDLLADPQPRFLAELVDLPLELARESRYPELWRHGGVEL